MSDENPTEIPAENYPKIGNYTFDLEAKLTSILALRSQMSSDAFTAGHLGTEREGHGVLISENGLVLTIGYLITEAETIWLVDATGVATPVENSPVPLPLRKPYVPSLESMVPYASAFL